VGRGSAREPGGSDQGGGQLLVEGRHRPVVQLTGHLADGDRKLHGLGGGLGGGIGRCAHGSNISDPDCLLNRLAKEKP